MMEESVARTYRHLAVNNDLHSYLLQCVDSNSNVHAATQDVNMIISNTL